MAPTSKSPGNKSPVKPAKTRTVKPKPEAASPRPALKVVEAPAPVAAEGKAAVLRLKDLVDRVATATGTKKPEAKKSVEATLAAISTALQSGSTLALPPLGKLRVARKSGAVLTLKLRQGEAGKGGEKAGAKPLAEDGEDD